MSPEIYHINYFQVPIEVHLTHADADQILASVGLNIPKIPTGCNTVVAFFEMKSGLQAMAVNQTSFRHSKRDNEQELNGCSVYVCADPTLDLIDARRSLQKFMNWIHF